MLAPSSERGFARSAVIFCRPGADYRLVWPSMPQSWPRLS